MRLESKRAVCFCFSPALIQPSHLPPNCSTMHVTTTHPPTHSPLNAPLGQTQTPPSSAQWTSGYPSLGMRRNDSSLIHPTASRLFTRPTSPPSTSPSSAPHGPSPTHHHAEGDGAEGRHRAAGRFLREEVRALASQSSIVQITHPSMPFCSLYPLHPPPLISPPPSPLPYAFPPFAPHHSPSPPSPFLPPPGAIGRVHGRSFRR